MDFAANIEKVREVRDREIFYSIESVIGNIREISSCALCYIFSAAGIGAHSPPKRPKRFSPTSPTAASSYATAQISTTSFRLQWSWTAAFDTSELSRSRVHFRLERVHSKSNARTSRERSRSSLRTLSSIREAVAIYSSYIEDRNTVPWGFSCWIQCRDLSTFRVSNICAGRKLCFLLIVGSSIHGASFSLFLDSSL